MKGTIGHAIGSAIIGKGDSNPMPPAFGQSGSAPAQHPMSGIHSIEVKPADNGGVTVTHIPKVQHKNPGKGKADPGAPVAGDADYQKSQTNVFGDHKSAHAHVSQLMGCSHGS